MLVHQRTCVMTESRAKARLELDMIEHQATVDGVEEWIFRTSSGIIPVRFHIAGEGNAAILWVGGAGGGLDGPAGGMYPRLAGQLANVGVASLRLHYRKPGDLPECVMDILLGIEYLASRERGKVVLVGHSFGGAVVISAGAVSDRVVAVVAMSSQTYGTSQVSQLSPKPLMLIHGTQDEVLPESCSHELYRRARLPKDILLYPGCRHGLDECRDEVDRDLMYWITQTLRERT
jgi:alpha-beta hydrolase superfamily lysophospholipase